MSTYAHTSGVGRLAVAFAAVTAALAAQAIADRASDVGLVKRLERYAELCVQIEPLDREEQNETLRAAGFQNFDNGAVNYLRARYMERARLLAHHRNDADAVAQAAAFVGRGWNSVFKPRFGRVPRFFRDEAGWVMRVDSPMYPRIREGKYPSGDAHRCIVFGTGELAATDAASVAAAFLPAEEEVSVFWTEGRDYYHANGDLDRSPVPDPYIRIAVHQGITEAGIQPHIELHFEWIREDPEPFAQGIEK